MTSHRTDGNVTYLKSYGVRYIRDDRGRIVDAEFSALGEADPALQRQPPPIPVIAIGDEPHHYGHADLRLQEPEEYAVWAPHHSRAAGRRYRIKWRAVILWIAISLILVTAWYFLIDLALQITPF